MIPPTPDETRAKSAPPAGLHLGVSGAYKAGVAEFKKYPYRSVFPDSSESGRNHQTLEDALQWSRWTLHSRWRETNEYGVEGDYVRDAETAVITNRNTGYRWILRRKESTVEFQTPGMFEDLVGDQSIDVHLSIEEAEASGGRPSRRR